MNFPKLSNINLEGKKVIVRGDLDVRLDIKSQLFRLETLLPTLEYLISKNSKIILIGHKGRPEKEKEKDLSLESISQELAKMLGKNISFVKEIEEIGDEDLVCLENLRLDPREEKNEPSFAKELASLGEIYINEAFATSHRKHASIVGIPRIIPGYLGLRFEKEVESLSRISNNPKKPVMAIISGVKKDKVEYAKDLVKKVDKVLVGGRLPEYFEEDKSIREYKEEDGLIIANLTYDKEDITLHSIERFKKEIEKAGTVILAGVLGKYEEEGHRQGTKEIFEAVANSEAYKVVGGGESLVALDMFKIKEKFDWVSVGGGAMLEFLINETLPGIKALLH